MYTDTHGRQGTHHIYEWRGTSYEVGFQHGSTLRQEIISEYAPILVSAAQTLGVSEQVLAARVTARYAPVFYELVPRVQEEIEGLAAGSGLTYEQAFFAATRDGADITRAVTTACTSFVCGPGATLENKILIGQTKDTGAPLDRYRIMRIAYHNGECTE